MENKINLSDLIAPSFNTVHRRIQNGEFTHYWLKGGRGSTKSSFAAIEIILGMMKHPDRNAAVLRKVKANLRDSVIAQLEWAAEMLGVGHLWQTKYNTLEMVYEKTGQKILFCGADDSHKLKSKKTKKGYFGYIWYEELDEFSGMEEIRSINQSLMRGGESFTVIYTYNPPKSAASWVNAETLQIRPDRYCHSSTYLDVNPDWLGGQFIAEAETLKRQNREIYDHEYMGVVTGTGGEVFRNLTIREISDEEIETFDKVRMGIDFGYASDPFAYVACQYHNGRLFIFDEIYKTYLSNPAAAAEIKKRRRYNSYITCDSAEPKSIRELRDMGLRVRGAKKGPDSVEYGIKFLSCADEIVIDPVRCPNAAKEFALYEIERDANGMFKACYPDRNNHTIDAVRYALEDETAFRRAKVFAKRRLNI